MDKKGRLSTLLFIGVTALPLVALLIMDYQVKMANDLTGAYILDGPVAYAADNVYAGAILLGVLVFALVGLAFIRIRKSRLISTMPLAKINNEIEEIEKRLGNN